MKCNHCLKAAPLPLQKNALRIEAITQEMCCALMPKKDRFGREYDPIRYTYSGGDPIYVAHPCVGLESKNCPLNKT